MIAVVVVVAILVASIYVLDYFGYFKPPIVTNAKEGYVGNYSYLTTYGQVTYNNSFSVTVTGVSGQKVSFTERQTVVRNATLSSPIVSNNYSLAFDPSKPNTYTAGSELLLFVANNLQSGSGNTDLIPPGSTVIVPVSYNVTIANGIIKINFHYYSGPNTKAATFWRWVMTYNETTSFLKYGTVTIVTTEFSYTSFNYTLASFTS
jgi:hypothetical protein